MVLPAFGACYGDRPAKRQTWETTPAAGSDQGLARNVPHDKQERILSGYNKQTNLVK